jgi:hypothetical protein
MGFMKRRRRCVTVSVAEILAVERGTGQKNVKTIMATMNVTGFAKKRRRIAVKTGEWSGALVIGPMAHV